MQARALLPYLLLLLAIAPASGATPEIPTVDMNQIVPQAAVNDIVKTLGILTNHRSYHGATPISGLDIGFEATLVHLPDGFGSSLSEVGMGDISGMNAGALPTLKAHIHKGLGPTAELGASGLYYPGQLIWGLDLKFVLAQPEEGLTWAFRISYSDTSLDLAKLGLKGIPINISGTEVGQGNLKLNSRTITPQLIASRRLDFAEPYIGAGVEFTAGQIEVPIKLNILPEEQLLTSGAARATEATLFTGVSFRVPQLGVLLAIEGAWGSLGMHTLGVMAGFAF